MKKETAYCPFLLFVAGFFLILTGCEAVFTYSPLSFLQRDHADLSDEQQIVWAEEALASGDTEAMKEGYDAIKELAVDSSDAEETYLAANLAMELSGAPELLNDIMEGTLDLSSESELDEFFETIQEEYVEDAAGFFQSTYDNDPTLLSGTDYMLGAACILFEAAADSNGDVSNLDPTDVDPALSFLQNGMTQIGEDDPAYSLLEMMEGFFTDF